MSYVNPQVTSYLHLETDEEFISRMREVQPKLHPHIAPLRGAELDDYVWNSCRMQRKLVEVNPSVRGSDR